MPSSIYTNILLRFKVTIKYRIIGAKKNPTGPNRHKHIRAKITEKIYIICQKFNK